MLHQRKKVMSIKNQRGRPTKHRQLAIHESMIECFEDDLSAPTASRKTGVDVKTAYKHYDEIINQRKEENFANLFERQEREKVQIIATFDKDIEEITEFIKQIRDTKQKCIDDGKSIPNSLLGYELDAMKFRFTVKEKKSSYVIQPTPEEVYKKRTEDVADANS